MRRTELQKIFRRERVKFVLAGFLSAWKAHLVISDRPCTFNGCAARDLAYAYPDSGRIVILSRALRLSRNHLLGIIRHELGHVADTSSASGAEKRADHIAFLATGARIRYGHNDVQIVGNGHSRPKYLHQ